jgi:hypothetical protein
MISLFLHAESALHAFPLFKDDAAYETTTNFMVSRADRGGWSACFDLVYEPGGYWAWRRGTER